MAACGRAEIANAAFKKKLGLKEHHDELEYIHTDQIVFINSMSFPETHLALYIVISSTHMEIIIHQAQNHKEIQIYIINDNGDRVHIALYEVGNENICEIRVENVEPELINVYNISWFTLLSWREL